METILSNNWREVDSRKEPPIVRVAGLVNPSKNQYAAYEICLGKTIKETMLPCKTPEECQIWCDMMDYQLRPVSEMQQYSFTYMCHHIGTYYGTA